MMSNKYWTDKKDGVDNVSAEPVNEAFDEIAEDITNLTTHLDYIAQQVEAVGAEQKEFENKSTGMFANSVTATKTGSVINIDNAPPYEIPIDCSVNVGEKTTGELIVVGANLIPMPYAFSNDGFLKIEGVTFATNDDGTITVNGTATNEIQIPLVISNSVFDKILVPGETYYFDGTSIIRPTSWAQIRITKQDGSNTRINSRSLITIPEDFSSAAIWIMIDSGTTFKNRIFKPHLYFSNISRKYKYEDIGKFNATYYMFDTATGKMLEPVKNKSPQCTMITTEGEKITATYTTDTNELRTVSTSRIEDGAVTADKISFGAVTTNKLVDGAVSGDKIAERTITSNNMAMNEINRVLHSDRSGYQKVWRNDGDDTEAESRIMARKCYTFGDNCYAGCGVFNIYDVSDDGLTFKIACYYWVDLKAGEVISYKDVETPNTVCNAAVIEEIISNPAPSTWEIRVDKPFPKTATFAFFLEHPEWGITYEEYMKNAVAFGNNNKALGENSVTFGNGNMSYGENSLTSGTENKAAWSSVAMGGWNEASGSLSTAFGSSNKATGTRSFAVGYCNEANRDNSFACGRDTVAQEENQFVAGQYNKDNSNASFIIGNGSDANNRSNALEVLKDGSIATDAIILKSSTTGSTARYKITVSDGGVLSATLFDGKEAPRPGSDDSEIAEID